MRVPVPGGTVSGAQDVPPSLVPIRTGLPKIPNPTAVQTEVDAQEIPLRPLTSAGIG